MSHDEDACVLPCFRFVVWEIQFFAQASLVGKNSNLLFQPTWFDQPVQLACWYRSVLIPGGVACEPLR